MACDDGNHADADDCRNDCTRPACCSLDSPSSSACDDGNPCTDDFLYPKTGCASLANDHWTLRAYAKNVTDERAYSFIGSNSSALTGATVNLGASPIQPRTFGLEFDYRF